MRSFHNGSYGISSFPSCKSNHVHVAFGHLVVVETISRYGLMGLLILCSRLYILEAADNVQSHHVIYI